MKRRNEEMAQVTAVNISEKKGVRKHEVPYIDVKYRHGIVGDAHAGDWHRQISLLADESVDTMRAICQLELDAGIFAENINTRGIELKTLPVGTRLRVGETELEVTQIGSFTPLRIIFSCPQRARSRSAASFSCTMPDVISQT